MPKEEGVSIERQKEIIKKYSKLTDEEIRKIEEEEDRELNIKAINNLFQAIVHTEITLDDITDVRDMINFYAPILGFNVVEYLVLLAASGASAADQEQA